MKTRSPTKYESSTLYAVNIDFDAASEDWKANKKSIGNSSYKYVCTKRGKNNKFCIFKCLPGEDYCRNHLKLFNKDRL